MRRNKNFNFSTLQRYFIAIAAIVVTIAVLEFFHSRINSTTVAFIFLTIILFVATFLGRNPALLVSLVAMLGFNYFFLPPFRTFTISDPQNLVTWAAFTITAIIVGQLSASVKSRAEEAEKQKDEIKKLYDELQTAEVLYNLLENAVKYAPPKTVIEISARKSDNETVEFAVTDEGTGVAEDLREKIFDKFFRVSDAKNGEHAPSGTGLGLAIAKGLVEAHGGKIFVTDGANKTGAKFIFTVPIGDE